VIWMAVVQLANIIAAAVQPVRLSSLRPQG